MITELYIKAHFLCKIPGFFQNLDLWALLVCLVCCDNFPRYGWKIWKLASVSKRFKSLYQQLPARMLIQILSFWMMFCFYPCHEEVFSIRTIVINQFFKALNPSMSDLPEAESAVRVQLKPSEERNQRTSRKSRGWSGEGKEGNMGLYVHRNHLGLLGTGKLGGREFLYLTPTRCTVTTRMILH